MGHDVESQRDERSGGPALSFAPDGAWNPCFRAYPRDESRGYFRSSLRDWSKRALGLNPRLEDFAFLLETNPEVRPGVKIPRDDSRIEPLNRGAAFTPLQGSSLFSVEWLRAAGWRMKCRYFPEWFRSNPLAIIFHDIEGAGFKQFNARPHPGPLPRGEGETLPAFRRNGHCESKEISGLVAGKKFIPLKTARNLVNAALRRLRRGWAYLTFNSRWMPNFSMRLRSVARVMPSSFAA